MTHKESSAETLHDLATYTKIAIQTVFFLLVVLGPYVFPSIRFPYQMEIGINLSISVVTSIAYELLIRWSKKRNKDYSVILNIQLITSVILLAFFLHFFYRINGPLFILYGLTIMESSLNLNAQLALAVGGIMVFSTVGEWLFLVVNGEIPFNLANSLFLFARVLFLLLMMNYSRSLAKTILGERQLKKEAQSMSTKLEKANIHLKELDRLKDELVSVTSHELRTPMTAIRSYLWLALQGKGGPLTAKLRFYLERSYDSTVRLIKLANDLLNISRIESGRLGFDMQKINVQNLLNEVMTEVKPRVDEAGIHMKKQYHSEKVNMEVIGDPDKVKEVLINLIGNALKFTPQGGSVSFSFERKDETAVIHISDTGQGIEKEDIGKLFNKFGMVKGSYVINQKAERGTGLGLYISRSLIRKMGGDMWATSEGEGKGATFSFSLQIYSDREFEKIKKGKIDGMEIIHTEI